jgi:hypothetical protein
VSAAALHRPAVIALSPSWASRGSLNSAGERALFPGSNYDDMVSDTPGLVFDEEGIVHESQRFECSMSDTGALRRAIARTTTEAFDDDAVSATALRPRNA